MGYDLFFFFFFQAEDGIRDYKVTGVQTCALPISWADGDLESAEQDIILDRLSRQFASATDDHAALKIGRASCRERV